MAHYKILTKLKKKRGNRNWGTGKKTQHTENTSMTEVNPSEITSKVKILNSIKKQKKAD